jgi:hypothetical protein
MMDIYVIIIFFIYDYISIKMDLTEILNKIIKGKLFTTDTKTHIV